MNCESKHDADTMKKHHDLTLKTGPAVMFDMQEILDSETLDTQLIRDDIKRSVVLSWNSPARTGMVSSGNTMLKYLFRRTMPVKAKSVSSVRNGRISKKIQTGRLFRKPEKRP